MGLSERGEIIDFLRQDLRVHPALLDVQRDVLEPLGLVEDFLRGPGPLAVPAPAMRLGPPPGVPFSE